jgi:hypothetical protein
MSTYTHYYVFAAKGIQDFILSGNQLRLMIGGSSLINDLPKGFLDELLKTLQIPREHYDILSRNAGGARLLFTNEKSARRLHFALPLAIEDYCPGLSFTQALIPIQENQSLGDTMRIAEERMRQKRNCMYPSLPPPGPIVKRAPRSGLPAIRKGKEDEFIDASMNARDQAADKNPSLSSILPNFKNTPYDVEIETDMIDIAGKQEYMAIVHADGNGLGQYIINNILKDSGNHSMEKAVKKYKEFSDNLDQATKKAVCEAIESLDLPKEGKVDALPLRPLICAGDDVTILLKAEHAIQFSKFFLQKFEENTQATLGHPFTACVGIVFQHSKFPFYQGYALCESLCKYAKDKTERKASALAFHRITSGYRPDYNDVIEKDLATKEGLQLTRNPYVIQQDTEHASLDNLEKLASLLHKAPRGTFRQLIDDLHRSKADAQSNYARGIMILKEREKESDAEQLQEVLKQLESFPEKGESQTTAIYDALELISATKTSTAQS